MDERDYYEVLQLHPTADHAMIVRAYWHLARKYKAAMDQDGSVEHAIEELNRSFDVLGAPESRAAYDSARAAELAAPQPPEPTRRISIEVSFWHLPPWQAVLAATATVVLTIIALAAGAQPLVTFVLAAVAIAAALLAVPDRLPLLRGGRSIPGRKRWRRELRASDLERSTSQILARWRETNADSGAATPLVEISRDGRYPSEPWSHPHSDR